MMVCWGLVTVWGSAVVFINGCFFSRYGRFVNVGGVGWWLDCYYCFDEWVVLMLEVLWLWMCWLWMSRLVRRFRSRFFCRESRKLFWW